MAVEGMMVESCVCVGLSHCMPFFPKRFTVGVLNAVLSVSALAGVLCPPR